MIFVSNIFSEESNFKFDEPHCVYNSSVSDSSFPQYDFFAYEKFKAHWINGIRMYNDYGQHYFGAGSSIVCAGIGEFDYSELISELKKSPNTTIVFQEGFISDGLNIDIVPIAIPNFFVAKYSTFMHLVSSWKWIDSHKNQPELMERDTYPTLFYRTICHRDLNYSILNIKTRSGEIIRGV